MPRYVAFLRGVSPMNAKMGDLKRCFESAGFTDVQTLLSSGNVAFTSRARPENALAKAAESAMQTEMGRSFPAIVRASSGLRHLIESDPFAAFRLPANAKRVVTFLRDAPGAGFSLPPETDGVRILAVKGREAFTAYVPHPRGPLFMTLIEKVFGAYVTTRTWDTVRKCAIA